MHGPRFFYALIVILTAVWICTETGFGMDTDAPVIPDWGSEEYRHPVITINGRCVPLAAGQDKSRQNGADKLLSRNMQGHVCLPFTDAAMHKTHAPLPYGEIPLYFIQNDGQMDERAEFYERGSGHAIFFTKEGVYLSLKPENTISYSAFVSLIPVGANKHPEIIAEGLQQGKVNYFIGNQEKWRTNIPTYSAIVYREIYEGIDIRFYGNNRQLEYDIIVKPGADPSLVRFACEGIEDLRVNENGDLEIIVKNSSNNFNGSNTEKKITQKRPYVYQEINGKHVEVEGKFVLQDMECMMQSFFPHPIQMGTNTNEERFTYGFKVAAYNKSHSLIIDPVILEYSTYIGGLEDDVGRGIAVDSSGAAYITGYTASADFPIAGTDTTKNNGTSTYDAFVTKLGTESPLEFIYSTYIGGSDDDYGYGIAVDETGSAYITGYTESSNFPVVGTASSLQGTRDAFITKLNATGNTIEYSTYIGGTGDWDIAQGIAVDNNGYTYITGYTDSNDFPVLGTDTVKNGELGYDAFVTKLGTGTPVELVYSTYLGGSWDDQGYAIAVDSSGAAYIAGETGSNEDFPEVGTETDRSSEEASNAFAAKFNAAGDTLEYSTYIGGMSADFARGIAVDSNGYAYITGYTESEDFPLAGTNTPYGGGSYDAYITKLGTGTPVEFAYSTYLGGSGEDQGNAIAVDGSGSAYVTGYTYSSDFPVVGTTTVAPHAADVYSAFLTKLETTGEEIAYSTYIGGGDNDNGYGITVDTSGSAYITGETESSNFPIAGTTTGWLEENYSSAFIAKVSLESEEETPVTPPSEPPPTVTLSVTSVSPSNGASGVSVTTSVTATFSLTMNGSTLTTDTFFLSGSSGNVSGIVSTNGSTATFTPSENLDYNTTYQATITTGAQAANYAGTTLSSNYSWSFTTESAPVPTPTPVLTVNPTPTVAATITPTATVSPTLTLFPSPSPLPSPSPTSVQGITGSLSLSKMKAFLSGDTVVVTVVDSDRNTDTTSEDVLTTAMKVVGVNYYSGDDLLLDLYEDGVDSGTFLATIRTGTTTSGGADSNERANIGTLKTVQDGTATVTYADTAPPGTEISEELTFSSFNAKITFDDDTCITGSFIGIILADAEQNTNHTEAEFLNDSVFVQTSRFNSTKVRMVETGTDTGIFTGAVLVAKSGGSLEYDHIQAGMGDTLTALYIDDINTTGSVMLVTDTASVIDAAPTPSITPTPYVCTDEDVEVSPRRLKLDKNGSSEVTVIVTGEDGCLVTDESISVDINKSGKKRITVSPEKGRTDSQGEAVFTVTALNKKGSARVRFKTENAKGTLKVKVNK
ncbi:MAG: hypothetical protein E3K37_01995 [Candidatus Kuenenia sp.]|nr:hypothetical protein [Candidatus Kuenenia hertensis]